jgi:general secretion pathway protein B
MSLILDALKKSEAERQRQSGPTLLEVRVTQPRRRYPSWMIAVGVLLAVNMLLLLAFILRRPATTAAPASAAPAAASMPGAASIPGAASAPVAGALPAGVAPIAAPGAQPLPAGAEVGVLVVPPRLSPEPDLAADDQGGTGNPADDEPAVPAGTAGRYSSLPSFNDVGGDLPELRLDLHVYAVHGRDRYALINMHRVHEGDTLAEGPRVLAITREGVALDYRGQQFMLRPQ